MAALTALLTAPAASADRTNSSNWAGYAGHRSGVQFRSVSARWRIPAATCNAGSASYSSIWVGLGGYSHRSKALEQTGTELDCTRGGRAIYSAWYELVPAPSHDLDLRVEPGDAMRATVTARGHQVTLALQDLSSGRSFRRTFTVFRLDRASAEWILEAPSGCDGAGNCFALPLADFGAATFTAAHAVTHSGRAGTVTSPWWGTTAITLRSHGSRLFAGTADGGVALASPSALFSGGSRFRVVYHASRSPGP